MAAWERTAASRSWPPRQSASHCCVPVRGSVRARCHSAWRDLRNFLAPSLRSGDYGHGGGSISAPCAGMHPNATSAYNEPAIAYSGQRERSLLSTANGRSEAAPRPSRCPCDDSSISECRTSQLTSASKRTSETVAERSSTTRCSATAIRETVNVLASSQPARRVERHAHGGPVLRVGERDVQQ